MQASLIRIDQDTDDKFGWQDVRVLVATLFRRKKRELCYKNAYRLLQWPPLDVSTREGDQPGGGHVDRQTLLKTLPSLAVGKNFSQDASKCKRQICFKERNMKIIFVSVISSASSFGGLNLLYL